MSEIRGKTVLITGGAQGLGRRMAELLIAEGAACVVLWDIQRELLEKTAGELRRSGGAVSAERVRTDIVDVSKTSEILAAVERLGRDGVAVDILINNAGIIVGKEFVAHSQEEIDRTMSINTTALMHLTRALLPGMMARDSGHIVNIASAAGMVSNPRMSVYCASKAAVLYWSDSLRLEMERGRTGVKVTTVTPYYIDTGMFAGVRSPLLPLVKTDHAARAVVRGIRRNRIFVRMPWMIYLLPLARGLMTQRMFDVVVGRGLGVYKTMDEFVGRSAGGRG
jgi:all-trans-retinol dehydrogenase (NAD+)